MFKCIKRSGELRKEGKTYEVVWNMCEVNKCGVLKRLRI